MALDVVTETVIACPRAAVAAYVADPDRATEWYVNIQAVLWQTPRPMTVGSRVAFVAWFLGKRLAYIYEIAEYEPGSRLVMRTSQGPFPMETIYIWEDAPGGATRMVLRNRGAPVGFSRWIAPFMAVAVRRANRKDLVRLKSILEGGKP
jgi:Polyketide cyclase / dehydrase and lipid transport